LIKYSGEPLKRYGCVKMESACAPPDIIDSAICSGSEICLMSPSAGDENFISVIRDACLLFFINCCKSISDFGNVSVIS